MIHNKKFIGKFNEAIKELNGDTIAISTFTLAVNEVYDMFAKNNKITGIELRRKLLEIEEMKVR